MRQRPHRLLLEAVGIEHIDIIRHIRQLIIQEIIAGILIGLHVETMLRAETAVHQPGRELALIADIADELLPIGQLDRGLLLRLQQRIVAIVAIAELRPDGQPVAHIVEVHLHDERLEAIVALELLRYADIGQGFEAWQHHGVELPQLVFLQIHMIRRGKYLP